MPILILTKDMSTELCDEGYVWASQWKWFFNQRGDSQPGVGYACRWTSIFNDDGSRRKRKMLYLHKELAAHFKVNGFEKETIDHKDHNRLNNKLSNLRGATFQEQARNTGKHDRNAISKFKGVTMTSGRWCAQITIDYKVMVIGYFESEEEAAKAYAIKSKELFGEFAGTTL